ncbi:NR6A1 [Cordylochernes scorpioides]|uniref:NR6A1 n=1 Tax=Cordylochernes scorpioides TaxID=51811 RepID=A0ABY6LG15_9ARAC|nr:NR6A1 [Cordylochernes scorpioides]
MHSLREALNEKRPEWCEKHNKLILQHDNAPAQNARVVKNTIKDLGWELLPHPPYSPDLAPSDYHLFTSLGHALKNQEFSNSEILRKWFVDWFDSEGIEFFRQGIRKLPESYCHTSVTASLTWSWNLERTLSTSASDGLHCGDFTMEQKLKQRICIAFCVKLQISAAETFEMLNRAFPNDAPKRTTVFEWHSRFKVGRISIEDDPRQGSPKF